MDAAALQARIYAGYAQTAKRMGYEHDVYRPANGLNPLAAANKVGTLPVAFSSERKFVRPQKYNMPVWYCWADGRELQPRDILVGPHGTFYIADMQPDLPIQAVKCNHTVSIGRPGYSISGAVVQVLTPIATALPIFTQLKRVDIRSPQFGGETAGQAITHWTAFIPMVQGSLKQHDIVTDEDEGIDYELDAPDYTTLGYVASIRLAQT